MALLLTESFDWFATSKISGQDNVYGLLSYQSGGNSSPTETIEAGRTGNSWKLITGTDSSGNLGGPGLQGRGFALAGGLSTYIVGFAHKYETTQHSSGTPLCWWRSGPSYESGINVTDAGAILACRYYTSGARYSLLGTSEGNVLPLGDWNYVEVKFHVANSGGYIIVKVNGVEVLNLTGVDTQYSNAALSAVYLGSCGRYNTARTVWFDDIYICDTLGSANNDFLGDCKVQLLAPSGNGNYSDFVGSDDDSADNYLHVDDAESPDDDTSYVESATSADQDTYAHENTADCDTVHGVGVKVLAKKTEGGSPDLKALARSGTTDEASDALGFGTDYQAKQVVYEQDPDTSAAWTTGGVDNAEFGIEVA
jgi:hypothetical protein